MKVVGFVFARGGSKGIPRKNLRLLRGKPLIVHAIEAALASRYIPRVVISTDDEEIAGVARKHGAEVPFMRPAELASDTASEWLAWQHAIRAVSGGDRPNFDIIVSVPATAPLRAPADIDACVEMLIESGADGVTAVTEPHRNPYFNMVVLDEARRARVVMGNEKQFVRRQDAPPVYDMTTVVDAARPEWVLRVDGFFQGDVRAVIVPRERALDIDSELDLEMAEFLLARRERLGAVPVAGQGEKA
jgi:N-acylneuraminate cytidylyltransferase